MIESCSRKSDYLCRWGGDEFLIFLPRTNQEEVKKFTQKLEKEAKRINYSFSLGTSTYQKGKTFEQLIKEADKKMYFSKKQKNE